MLGRVLYDMGRSLARSSARTAGYMAHGPTPRYSTSRVRTPAERLQDAKDRAEFETKVQELERKHLRESTVLGHPDVEGTIGKPGMDEWQRRRHTQGNRRLFWGFVIGVLFVPLDWWVASLVLNFDTLSVGNTLLVILVVPFVTWFWWTFWWGGVGASGRFYRSVNRQFAAQGWPVEDLMRDIKEANREAMLARYAKIRAEREAEKSPSKVERQARAVPPYLP